MKLFEVDTNYQTPIPVCEYMVNMVPRDAKLILEPFPGIGNLVKVLDERNIYQPIVTPDDYFLLDQNKRYDCIIMNPPFSSNSAFLDNAPSEIKEMKGMKVGYYVLRQCMEMSNNVIALMPWYTISDSDVRMRHLKGYGIKSLTALPRKTFKYARIQTVIIELRKGYKRETIFRTFQF